MPMPQLLVRLVVFLALVVPALCRAEPVPSGAGVVNITFASVDELRRLPGIGEKKALAIIEHRKKQPLRRLEDLAKVKGIGRKTVQRLRPYLTMMGPTTLRERPPRVVR
jgi:competence ComEA-like helix-hairpin-helix protein